MRDFRVAGADGIVRWLESIGRSYYDPAGRPIRVIGLNLDITDRKHAELALHEAKSAADAARLDAERASAAKPGAWSGFERGVRAILGRQVSVAAATRLAGRPVAAPDLFAAGQDPSAARARLTAICGIGPWTAQSVAMRALREPDALPVGDIGLMRALDTGTGRPSPAGLLSCAEGSRPYRAYAAMHLWAADAGGG